MADDRDVDMSITNEHRVAGTDDIRNVSTEADMAQNQIRISAARARQSDRRAAWDELRQLIHVNSGASDFDVDSIVSALHANPDVVLRALGLIARTTTEALDYAADVWQPRAAFAPCPKCAIQFPGDELDHHIACCGGGV